MAQENPDATTHVTDPATIRRRRWFLAGLVLGYLPGTVAALRMTQSNQLLGILFGVWFILLCVAVALVASARCPSCGNTFHMRNSTLSFRGTCRHCGFPAKGDRTV